MLTFKIVQKQGTFGTLIKTFLPKPARKWAYVTHFDMHLRRVYTYKGEKHSFISAGCAAPAGFPGAVFPFARANFGFAGGKPRDKHAGKGLHCALRGPFSAGKFRSTAFSHSASALRPSVWSWALTLIRSARTSTASVSPSWARRSMPSA